MLVAFIIFILAVVAVFVAYRIGREAALIAFFFHIPEKGSNAYWKENIWLQKRKLTVTDKEFHKDGRDWFYRQGFHDGMSEIRRMLEERVPRLRNE